MLRPHRTQQNEILSGLEVEDSQRFAEPPTSIQTVAELPVGSRCILHAVLAPGLLGERLLELGLTPGTPFMITQRGARGTPISLAVRGYILAIQNTEARMLLARMCQNETVLTEALTGLKE